MRNSTGLLSSPRGPETGTILALAIWVLMFLSILTAGIYAAASSQLALSQRIEGRIIGQYAVPAVSRVFALEREKKESSADTLAVLSAERTVVLGQAEARYTVTDEERKININLAGPGVLENLVKKTAGLGDLAAHGRVVDIIAYREKQKFRIPEELVCVDGVSLDEVNTLRDYVTVYGNGAVNINTAPPVVLSSLGFDDSLVELIVRYRSGADGKEGTKDDLVFESPDEVLSSLRSFGGLSSASEAALLEAVTGGELGVCSVYFAVHTRVFVRNKLSGYYGAVVNNAGNIQRWLE